MSTEVPLWAAVIIVAFLLLGSGLTLIGCIGLVRFTNFYDRLHAPTLGTSCGVGSILVASLFYSSVLAGKLVLHEILIACFLIITTPVTLMMLSRAAVLRDNTNNQGQLSEDSTLKNPDKDRKSFL